MLNYMLIKHKMIFEYFSCFWKMCNPILATCLIGQASCMPQFRAYIEGFCDSLVGQSPSRKIVLEFFFKNLVFQISCDSIWRLVREWKLQSRVLLRTFGDSCHDSLASGTSCRKKNFKTNFKILSHGFLVTCFGNLFATQYSREKRVFCTLIVFFKTILKTFQFSLTHCDCSLSCPFISLTNSLCFSQKSTIFFIISSSNFKERYGVFIFLKAFLIYSL